MGSKKKKKQGKTESQPFSEANHMGGVFMGEPLRNWGWGRQNPKGIKKKKKEGAGGGKNKLLAQQKRGEMGNNVTFWDNRDQNRKRGNETKKIRGLSKKSRVLRGRGFGKGVQRKETTARGKRPRRERKL